MRVAIFAETFLPKWDGITNTLCRLLEHLESEGHESIMFAPEGAPSSYASTRIHGYPAFNCPWYNDLRLATPLGTATREIEEFQPDVIHVASPLLLGAMGLKKAKQMGVPVVASYHTDVPGYMEHYGFGALRQPSWALFRWLHNQADLNVCPSTHTRRQLEEHGFERVEIWARGVDTDLYSPTRFSFQMRDRMSGGVPDAPLLLYAGRLAVEKRLDLLRPVLDEVPGARLCLVGSGPAEEVLRSIFRGTDTTFMGYLKGEDLAAAYASADVFVFPSESETFGNVVLEAMASGLTAVCAAAGGPLDIVDHGRNGYLFTPGRHAEISSLLEWLIAHPGPSRAIGQRARIHAEANSWTNVMVGLVNRYRELAELSEAERPALAG
ncbi:MAG TPA: glycosyltransferase family 1 protein [Candidatus Krumholzibacteria bacterium]|nr:glycosyltransferase family 1 protein [Candidatus Krumholzibacteria bacterium]